MVIRKIEGNLPITVSLVVLPASEPGDGGDVTLQTTAGHRFVVPLAKRHFRVLKVLMEARFEDEYIDSDLRGVRTVTAIRRAYSAQLNEVAMISPESLRRYVCEIRAAFDLALEQVADELGLRELDRGQFVIKTVVNRGYQIGQVSIVYIDHSA